MITVNLNIVIDKSCKPAEVAAKALEVHRLLAGQLPDPASAEPSELRRLKKYGGKVLAYRREWTRLTGQQRYKMTKDEKGAKDSGRATEEQILRDAIERVGGQGPPEDQGDTIPRDDGKHPYM